MANRLVVESSLVFLRESTPFWKACYTRALDIRHSFRIARTTPRTPGPRTVEAPTVISIYRRFKGLFPGRLRPEPDIVAEVRGREFETTGRQD